MVPRVDYPILDGRKDLQYEGEFYGAVQWLSDRCFRELAASSRGVYTIQIYSTDVVIERDVRPVLELFDSL